mgnify:CR=1 FL=1
MTPCCSLQSLQFCSFAVSEYRKGKIPARLQELQTANGRFHLQESTKESIMTEYRFHLQKYRPGSKTACPECGRKACFTRYIDETGEISFPDSVGMCDHINSCGYRYTPKEYFRDNPAVKERLNGRERNSCNPMAAKPPARTLPKQKPQISFLPSDWVEQSMRRYDINPLYRYFTKVIGKEDTDRLFRLYRVGTSKMWGGATMFWQTDRDGNVRAGKIMGYDAVTGHRIKEPFNQVSWVHSVRKVQDFRMKQCLFGEHLLSDSSAVMSDKPVAIVESEKTALVAAHFIPDFIWLATGGMHGCFNSEAMQVLDGREVILFPDLKATEEWRQRLPILESVCRRATCSDLLERIATNEQRSQGLDIADFLLMEDTPQMILARMIECNPMLQTFIDTFGLELVDAGRVE